jgi:ABC-type transport system substrate-binding protein
VRRALQYAVDLETLNAGYFGNENSVIVPALWNPTLGDWSAVGDWPAALSEQYVHNPEKAKQLLEEAGYGDGFEFTAVISPDNDVDLFTYVGATYFAPLGINMKLESVANFFEVKSVGNNEKDTRSTASSGVAAVGSLTAAQNQTLDGGWAAAIWNGDKEYAAILDGLAKAATTDEQTEYARQADLYYAEAHWAVHLSGLKTVSEYFSGRLQGYNEGNRLYSGKVFGAAISNLWVSR